LHQYTTVNIERNVFVDLKVVSRFHVKKCLSRKTNTKDFAIDP